MKEILVTPLSIFDPLVKKYGQAIARPETAPADSQGKGWKCWFPLGTLEGQLQWNIGLVEADLYEPIIRMVECHPTRQEWVFALDEPIIQIVALNSRHEPERADASSVQAVLLLPGQGILIDKGIWHAAGFPANLQHACYGFALAPVPVGVNEAGVISFANEDIVRVSIV